MDIDGRPVMQFHVCFGMDSSGGLGSQSVWNDPKNFLIGVHADLNLDQLKGCMEKALSNI